MIALGGEMRKLIFILVMLWCLPVFAVANDRVAAVGKVLDAFHEAAAKADGELYFSLFADDAVFMGTDATERWSVDEFKAFAEPYFSEGRGWTYTKTERHVSVSDGGETAWFDELLWNDTYGACRGTGVLVLTDGAWRIAQYNLTFPIPNDLAAEITARIKAFEQESSR
jgi:ketosteroid isomerase-like protein